MKIKTGLRIYTIFSICMVLSIGLTLLAISRQVRRIFETDGIADYVVHGVFDLKMITYDCLEPQKLEPQKKEAQMRWHLKFDSLSKHLTELSFKSPKEQAILDRMRQNHKDIKPIFSELTAAHENEGAVREESELRKILAKQLSIKLQSMVSDASLLEEISQKRIATIVQRSSLRVIIFTVWIMLNTTERHSVFKRQRY